VAYPKHENRRLSLADSLFKLSDPAKLRRFEALAEGSGYLTIIDFDPAGTGDALPRTGGAPERKNFQYSRSLIPLLSSPGGCDFFCRHQRNSGDRGRDAFSRYREMEGLFASLTADFLSAAIAGHLTVTGFVGTNIQTLDPQLFAVPGLRLHFERNEIELPDGRTVFGIGVKINQPPQAAALDGVTADPSSQSPELAASSINQGSGTIQLSQYSGRGSKGRIPKPIWKGAKTEALRWLADEGCPEPGDGGQTRLEEHIKDWLILSDYYPAESTVRRHVVLWIHEFRGNLP
jgi:hypothetical protein